MDYIVNLLTNVVYTLIQARKLNIVVHSTPNRDFPHVHVYVESNNEKILRGLILSEAWNTVRDMGKFWNEEAVYLDGKILKDEQAGIVVSDERYREADYAMGQAKKVEKLLTIAEDNRSYRFAAKM